MPQAVWNGQVVAQSVQTKVVEGNHYFPPDSLRDEYFQQSKTTTVCGWKGTASYFHINVNGEVNEDAAWCYRDPKPEAAEIAGFVAFWKGVEVSD